MYGNCLFWKPAGGFLGLFVTCYIFLPKVYELRLYSIFRNFVNLDLSDRAFRFIRRLAESGTRSLFINLQVILAWDIKTKPSKVGSYVFNDDISVSKVRLVCYHGMLSLTNKSVDTLYGHGRTFCSFGMSFLFDCIGFLYNFTNSDMGIIASTQHCCRSLYN